MESPLLDALSVSVFFEDAVRDAAKTRGVDPEAPSTLYAAGVLADFARPEGAQRASLDRPVTLLLYEALGTAGPERFQRLRDLGDQTLYLGGFFAEHYERRGVERRLLCDVGRTAYDRASSFLKRAGGETQGPDVFNELATHFVDLLGVLGDVADSLHATAARDSRSVVDLYERWMRRGTPALAEGLARLGVVPSKPSGAVH